MVLEGGTIFSTRTRLRVGIKRLAILFSFVKKLFGQSERVKQLFWVSPFKTRGIAGRGRSRGSSFSREKQKVIDLSPRVLSGF